MSQRLRLKIISHLGVVPKCCDGVWECFRGIRGVSVGRLKVSSSVSWYLWCLVLSLGVVGGVVVYFGGI